MVDLARAGKGKREMSTLWVIALLPWAVIWAFSAYTIAYIHDPERPIQTLLNIAILGPQGIVVLLLICGNIK